MTGRCQLAGNIHVSTPYKEPNMVPSEMPSEILYLLSSSSDPLEYFRCLKKIKLKMVRKTALIVVDLQEDFLPLNGALAVKEGRDTIPLICELLTDDKFKWSVVVASQDWHPKDHISFASQHGVPPFTELTFKHPTKGEGHDGEEIKQVVWPDHCIQNTFGSSLDPSFLAVFNSLKPTVKSSIVRKGYLKDREYYSCFQDCWKLHHTELNSLLKGEGVTDVVFVGLAYDYCVFHSAVDCAAAGYNTYVVRSCCKSVSSENNATTDQNYKAGNVTLVDTSSDLLERFRLFD